MNHRGQRLVTPFACTPGPGGPKWALVLFVLVLFGMLFLELQDNHRDTNSKCSLGFRNVEQNANN